MRKFVFAAIALLVAGCCSNGPNNRVAMGGNPPPVNPCDARPGGRNDPQAPIVCINYANFDQQNVQPSPNPVSDSRAASAQFWFYNTGSASPTLDLTFTFTPPNKQCNGGHCVVVVGPNAPLGQTKYSIKDTSTGRHQDPDILIEP